MSPILRTVGVLSGTVFLVMIGISIIVPALPQYGLELGATAFLAGVLVGALPAARVVLDLPSGALGDRYGNRAMMQLGLAIIAITSALAVLAFHFIVLLAVRVAEGIGSAFYVTSSLAALAKRIPAEHRGRYMGIYVNALLVGQIVGPVIGGFVVVAGGLRAPFAAYAILATVGLVLITFAMEPGRVDGMSARVDRAAVARLLRDRSYVLVNIGTMGTFFVRAGLITTVVPLFIFYNWGVVSREEANDSRAAIEQATERLEQRILRLKERRLSRKRDGHAREILPTGSSSEGDEDMLEEFFDESPGSAGNGGIPRGE